MAQLSTTAGPFGTPAQSAQDVFVPAPLTRVLSFYWRALSTSLLMHLLKGEGGAAEWRAAQGRVRAVADAAAVEDDRGVRRVGIAEAVIDHRLRRGARSDAGHGGGVDGRGAGVHRDVDGQA